MREGSKGAIIDDTGGVVVYAQGSKRHPQTDESALNAAEASTLQDPFETEPQVCGPTV